MEDLDIDDILKTHQTPTINDVDVSLIFNFVENVLQHPLNCEEEDIDTREIRESAIEGNEMLEKLAPIIYKVSSKISTDISPPKDDAYWNIYVEKLEETAMSVLRMLSNYSWDAKMMITVAAFALVYSECGLLVELNQQQQQQQQNNNQNPFVISVAALKRIPDLTKHPLNARDEVKKFLRNLSRAIGVMLDVAIKIIEVTKLPPKYISTEHPPLSILMKQVIPSAVHETIRAAAYYACEIASPNGTIFRDTYTNGLGIPWHIIFREYHGKLIEGLDGCYKHIEKIKSEEAYRNLISLFEKTHTDNTNVLKHLIYLGEDTLHPLVEGSKKLPVSIEELKTKTVLLLISDLNISHEELTTLDRIWKAKESRRTTNKSDYEIVWIPILDKSDFWNIEANKERYKQLVTKMPWYTLQHPEKLGGVGIRYIKEACKFEQKTMVLVIDPLGKMVCKNGLPMIWIWGKNFPFNAMEEKALWKDKVWNIELLVDAIDSNIQEWIQQGKSICLYGGEDMDWIKNFTRNTKKVANSSRIDQLELVYVGKSQKITKTIRNEKLSHTWNDLTWSWYFWTRLEYMLYSRMQYLQGNNNNQHSDHIVQEIQRVLSFDATTCDQGWAIFCHGNSEIMAMASGDMMLESFERFEKWEENAKIKGFVLALREDLKNNSTSEHCSRLILPNFDEEISDDTPFLCPECNQVMDVYTLVRCYAFDG